LKDYQLVLKPSSEPLPGDLVRDSIFLRMEMITQLIYRKTIGYANIEAITVQPDTLGNSILVLLSLAELENQHYILIGMMINTENFITDILSPKLQEISRGEFDLGVFQKDNPVPIYSVGNVEDNTDFLKRRIWLFPDHYLGIRKSGTSIEDIAQQRFKRNMQLIALLDGLLLIGAWIAYRNIRKEMELSQMKSDFVSNVSHELRTPLALIRMFVETLELERVKTEEKKKEYYTIIGQETERLTYLINNILDFSKMEAGKKVYHMESVDINELVQETVRIYAYHLKNKGFTLETDLFANGLSVHADRNALSEALLNLLENAVKYSEQVKHITVRTGREGKRTFIEVSDKGIGISAEQQKKIFEKFYRVSTGLEHNTKGSGLGLSIVQHIMKAHRGEISVTSQPGEGSIFKLYFHS
jgi:two-component system phosphate regulon sensor histidine kinase PhoR